MTHVCGFHFPINRRRLTVSSLSRTYSIVAAMSVISITAAGPADETDTKPAHPKPPAVEPVFHDDFSEDTRGDYEIKGDVIWEEGKLKLADGASVKRIINKGAWLKTRWDMQLPESADGDSESEVQLWFTMKNATDFFVRLNGPRKNATKPGSIALFDTGRENGNLIAMLVREQSLPDIANQPLTLEYRYGLVQVSTPSSTLLTAYINNASATVEAIHFSFAGKGGVIDGWQTAATNSLDRTFFPEETEQLQTAEAKFEETKQHFREGAFADALQAQEQVFRIRSAVYGRHSYEAIDARHILATLYSRVGDFRRAEPMLVQTLASHQRLLGDLHVETANVQNNLALLRAETGDLKQARQLYEQSLQAIKTVFGDRHTSYASSLNNLASLNHRLHEFDRAESQYVESLQIRRALLGEKHPACAESLNNLAGIYDDIGQAGKAEEFYRQALEIRRQSLGENHPLFAASLNNLAHCYATTGAYADAESLYRQALAILKSQVGTQNIEYATTLNNLADVYMALDEDGRAEPLYREALEIRKSMFGAGHPQYAASLNNIALLQKKMGDNDRAESLFKESLSIMEAVNATDSQSYARTLNNLANLYEITGRFNEAEDLYQRAIKIKAASLGTNHASYTTSLSNLAVLYLSMGHAEKARPILETIVETEESVLGENHPTYASSLHNLAAACEAAGEFENAELNYKKVLKIRALLFGTRNSRYGVTLHNLASLYRRLGRHTLAEQNYEQALEIQRRNLELNSSHQSFRQQLRHQTSGRYFLDAYLTQMLESDTSHARAINHLWKWKGSVTLRQRNYRELASDDQAAALFAELTSVTRHLAAHSSKPPVPPPKAAEASQHAQYRKHHALWKTRLEELILTKEGLEEKIAIASNGRMKLAPAPTVAELQASLPDRTAFVDFLQYRHNTQPDGESGTVKYDLNFLACVIRTDQKPFLIRLGSAKTLGDAALQFRKSLTVTRTAPEQTQSDATAAEILRTTLWLPIERHLTDIDTVIVSQDMLLGMLPFSALPGRSPESFLIEDYRLVSVPLSGLLPTLLQAKRPPPATVGSLLVVGDINYGTNDAAGSKEPTTKVFTEPQVRSVPRGNNTWRSLPGFRKELAVVKQLFERQFKTDVTLMRGVMATETDFIREASKHNQLHVVTHGFFADPEYAALQDLQDSVHPGPQSETQQAATREMIYRYVPGLLSGLVFAGANVPDATKNVRNDGILTASEIESTSLHGTDLVVLSACETGLGKVAGGEGLTGLQRAFHVAGARSVIASLWKVDDAATTELMRLFYSNLWEKKLSKLDALREAQLTMLNHYDAASGQLRGLGGNKVKVDPDKPAPKPDKIKRLDPRYWAAFQLSGDWR